MKLLLDTNIIVWLFDDPRRIRSSVRAAIAESGNQNFVSAISLLELASKAASGRLPFDDEAHRKTEALADWLPVLPSHSWRVRSLPLIHKDPFDRLLVAQAMEEDMTLVTGDRVLADYGVPVLLT